MSRRVYFLINDYNITTSGLEAPVNFIWDSLKHKNSLFEFLENYSKETIEESLKQNNGIYEIKIKVNSKFSGPKYDLLKFLPIKPNEFLDLLTKEKYIDDLFENSKKLSVEPISCTKPFKDQIISVIKNIGYKFCYEENLNLFNCLAIIFLALLTSHKLLNGNKRISFSFLTTTLYYSGFYFCNFDGQLPEYNKKIEEDIKGFINDYSELLYEDSTNANSNVINSENKIVRKIEKWILVHIVLRYK